MKSFIIALGITLGVSFTADAQLPNGSIAPDFSLQDLDGNWHNLYSYLADGKVVFIKFFACHCPGCWAYQNSGKLEELTNTYGPEGTDQVVVLMLEHDEYNGENEFYGNSPNSQGDWVTGNPNFIFDVEGGDRSVFSDYNMTYYPMIIKVCPDKTTEVMYTNQSVADLYQAADDCAGTLSIDPSIGYDDFHVYYSEGRLIYTQLEEINEIQVVNSIGQRMTVSSNEKGVIDASLYPSGIYNIRVFGTEGIAVRRVYIP